MSRQIDLSKPLSDEDRYYLETRGRNDLIEANDRNFQDDQYSAVDDGNTGDIDRFTNDNGTDVVTQMAPGEVATTPIQALAAGQAVDTPREPVHQAGEAFGEDGDPGLSASAGSPGPANEDEGVDNYDDESVWSYKDLQEEAKSREPAIAANQSRDDLIKALREDDATE